MKLWKDNKKNQEYEMSFDEIIKQFHQSKYHKLEMPLDRRLRLFLSSKDGLSSVFDPEEYERLFTEAIGEENKT